MAIVALSFVAFERRISSSVSVYAYIGHTFGQCWGIMAAWALLLTYIALTAGATAMTGNFLMTYLAEFGIRGPHLWIIPSLAGILIAY
jgi:amino acid transporter